MDQASSAERGARVRFPPPLVFLFTLLIGVAIDRYWLPAPLPIDRMVRIGLGVVVAFCGAGLLVSSRIQFKRTGQSVIPWTPTPALIIQPPYTFTRNPMYVGMTLVQIGLGIALGNRWIIALAVPALLIVHVIAVLPEEKYLALKFGEPYRAYLGKVRRYL
jgi:protein-S-isoprenylcysteine O-methyltransferase Ste14